MMDAKGLHVIWDKVDLDGLDDDLDDLSHLLLAKQFS